MRIRAGAVLIEDDKVTLIERYRDGKHYYVFPGGGVDEEETPEQAAIREMEEETGLRVTVRDKLAEIHFGLSIQHYFLVECLGGEFGSGTGEEYTDADPDHPAQGIYIPVWMPIAELPEHENNGSAGIIVEVPRSGLFHGDSQRARIFILLKLWIWFSSPLKLVGQKSQSFSWFIRIKRMSLPRQLTAGLRGV